jgi:hypothetical protein
MGMIFNDIEFWLRRILAVSVLITLTEGAAFPVGSLISSGPTAKRQITVLQQIRRTSFDAKDNTKSFDGLKAPKLSLRGGGSDPNPLEGTAGCTTRHRDVSPDITCALKNKVDPRSADHLEEEDVDGPQSDRGDVSEVPDYLSKINS